MLLKSIRLKNIRSYPDQTINFSEGSTLLAGDIGCGKSTLLMAVDFALFGLRKGELSGSDLLRHGSDHGEVELEFEIDKKTFSIKRTLHRKRDSVNQESGSFAGNGQKKELAATEITSRVLEIFGYPQEVLSKNRPLFRYTVYTPQEDMKSIIENENRIETVRKIFDIDKYSTIKNNSSFLLTFIRGEKRNLEGFTQDLEEKKRNLNEELFIKKSLADALQKQETTIHKLANELLAKQNEVEKTRKHLEKFREIKSRLENRKSEARMKKERMSRNSGEIEDLQGRISISMSSLEKYSAVRKPLLPLNEIRSIIEEKETELKKIISEKERARSHLDNIKKIYSRGICEICGQPVHDKERYAQSIRINEQVFDEIAARMNGIENKLAELKKAEIDAREYERAVEKKADMESKIGDYHVRLNRLSAENTDYQKETETARNECIELEKDLAGSGEMEKLLQGLEKDYSNMQLLYVAEQKKQSAVETQMREIEKNMEKLRKEIFEKEKSREKIMQLNEIISWLGDYFTDLMDMMEKHVMFAIQKEFNEYFQEWFSILMGDTLSVRISEDFSPVIEQNGYETEYRNLSGGEKTSVALAYRLAMNKVINDLMINIKTKDLLILDEPTDGFSTDQLDRIRDVLEKLKLRQIIIVSHEPKIDTYVDNVIRIYKEDHVSKVVA